MDDGDPMVQYQDVVEVVVVDDASMAKMSGSDVDVDLYLNSRNTKGYGIATQILKPRSANTCRRAIMAQKGGVVCGSGVGV